MYTKEEIQKLVQENIHHIKVSEFVTEGGWPNIDDIDIVIYSQKLVNDTETVRLQILYTVDKAGCCFIPGAEEHKRLSKTINICQNKIEFIS